MANPVVLFVGGPLHNELYAFEEPLRPWLHTETIKASKPQAKPAKHTYFLGHLNKFPVYIHKPLIPHDIKHN